MREKAGRHAPADRIDVRSGAQVPTGKTSLTGAISGWPPVQMKSTGATTEEVQRVAQTGIRGGGGRLPFYAEIQTSFGNHDVSPIRAHTDRAAASANTSLGSRAFATGEDVAFGGPPDLHTAAHEAAHVVQQRAVVHLKGGVGQPGDPYERHADQVADGVVAGRSVSELLDAIGGRRSPARATAVQKKDEHPEAGLDYQAGGTFTDGSEATHEIGPHDGPHTHIAPDEVPAMLSNLLAGENSKEVLEGHVAGIEQRVAYWQQTLPDFKDSATARSIASLLAKVKDKATTAASGRSTRDQNPTKLVQIMTPNEPASQDTWTQWLIEHKAEQDAVLGVIIHKTNVTTSTADGKVAPVVDPKSARNAPLAAAILALQRIPAHRAYATALAQALWASGSIPADDAFRQRDGWVSDLGFAVYYDSIAGRLAPFDGMARASRSTITTAARSATNEYMEKWVHDRKTVGPGDAKIRGAFYQAVRDLVQRTKSPTIALGFMDAMTDSMVANFADPNVRREIPDVEQNLRDILVAAGVPVGQLAAVRDEYADSIKEKSKLMDQDIHKNSVEVRYIKLYIGIRQAVQTVGEAWIAKRTQYLRDKLGDLASARTWVGRGVNVAWAFCPGPEFAVPVVLIGTIADIFLEMEAAKMQANLTAYETQLRGILDRESSSRLDNIAAQAQTDFATIDAGKAPALENKVFQDIGDIEKLYSGELIKALG
jgi:hypothetical protein